MRDQKTEGASAFEQAACAMSARKTSSKIDTFRHGIAQQDNNLLGRFSVIGTSRQTQPRWSRLRSDGKLLSGRGRGRGINCQIRMTALAAFCDSVREYSFVSTLSNIEFTARKGGCSAFFADYFCAIHLILLYIFEPQSA